MKAFKQINVGSDIRWMYEFLDCDANGEKVVVEISENLAGKEQVKLGYPQKWLGVHTYVGNTSKYNPFIRVETTPAPKGVSGNSPDGKKILRCYDDVSKLLEATEENKLKALQMVADLAFKEVQRDD